MGFEGFVVGDWNGHGQVAGCSVTDCAQSINAGLDMFMAPDSWKGLYETTLKQAKDGTIPAARLDDAVRRILRVKYKLGLFPEGHVDRSEEYTSELQSLMRISYAVFCLKKKNKAEQQSKTNQK